MTRPTINVDRLAYFGPEKPVAVVELKSGLNIVCGSSETGKSFIVDTIDFMLGGQSELRDLPERVGYDRIIMWITLSNGKKYSLQRSMQGGGYRWREGHHGDFTQDDEALKPTHSADRDDNLSRRILGLLELTDRRLRKDKDATTVSLSIRHLTYLSVVDETRIFDTLSPVLTKNKVNNTIEKAAFKLVLTGVDDSALVAVKEGRDTQARLVNNRNALAAVVEDRQSRLPPQDEVTQARDRLESLQKRIASIGDDVDEEEQRHAEASHQYRLLDRFVQSSRRRQGEIHGLLQRFELLNQHYDSDRSRLEAIAASGAIFRALHPGPCPFCGAPAEAQAHANACDVDPEQIVVAAQAEIRRIEALRSGLVETQRRLVVEGQQLRDRSDNALNEQSVVARRTQELATILRERRRGIGDLDNEAQQLRLQLRDADIVQELQAELIKFETAIETGEQQPGLGAAAGLPTAETTEFAQEIEAILKAWDFPGADRVAWDDRRTDVTIGARRRADQGKGLRAITCSAFLLALLKRCVDKGRPHLGLLVLDSPLLAYWKPEGTEDNLTGTHVDEYFYRWTATLPPKTQVIIIENRPLPDWISSIAHVIRFTKNKSVGRYGLFQPVAN
jgi:hypothetical protein